MAISDYSSTPANNTAIGGINIAEGWAPENVNNALRQLLADLAVWYASGGGGGSGTLDATLAALAGITTQEGSMIYATAMDAFATFVTTAFGRSLLQAGDAAAAQALLGGSSAGSASSGSIGIGNMTLTWKDVTISGSGTGFSTQTFGGNHQYSSWARAWVEGDDQTGPGDITVSYQVQNSATTTTTANIYYTQGASNTVTMFSIGV